MRFNLPAAQGAAGNQVRQSVCCHEGGAALNQEGLCANISLKTHQLTPASSAWPKPQPESEPVRTRAQKLETNTNATRASKTSAGLKSKRDDGETHWNPADLHVTLLTVIWPLMDERNHLKHYFSVSG